MSEVILSDEQFLAIRELVKAYHDASGKTYVQLADVIGVDHSKLMNFLNKGTLPRGNFIEEMYAQVLKLEQYSINDDNIKELISVVLGKSNVISEEISGPYQFVNSIFEVGKAAFEKYSRKYAGNYLCYRLHHDCEKLTVSWLHIHNYEKNVKVTRFTEFARDNGNSDDAIFVGYVVPVEKSAYFYGKSVTDMGPKNFVLENKKTRKVAEVEGVETSVTGEGRPYSSYCILVPAGAELTRQDVPIGRYDLGEIPSLNLPFFREKWLSELFKVIK